MQEKKYAKDVHTEHCCKEHGCKYGEDDTCTVTQGLKEQSYECEYCAEDRFNFYDCQNNDYGAGL